MNERAVGERNGAMTVWGVALLAVLLSAGCTSKSRTISGGGALPDERVAASPVKEILPDDQTSPLAPARTPASVPAQPIGHDGRGTRASGVLLDVLFDFDKATLRRDAVATVEANAKRLQELGTKRVVLEGRGDEVGTSAYNLVLGERRARSVKRYLHDLGLDTFKIQTTSYGKDRPLCRQRSRDCLQKNRSVHFKTKE
jgi:peptidoglycan-associated lipoprotein